MAHNTLDTKNDFFKSESSNSWTPSFQHPLPPISISLQSSLMLLVFLYYIRKHYLDLKKKDSDLQKFVQLLAILALGVSDIGPFLKLVIWIVLSKCHIGVMKSAHWQC